jgi:TorA maturation chaperone TorD
MSRTDPADMGLTPYAAASAAAAALAAFWGEPELKSLRLWRSEALQSDLALLAGMLEAGKHLLDPLRAALKSPHRVLAEEYERLFVGPGTVPCPPYEALWRKDRPKLEQGTVFGAVTGRVADLYDDIGVQMRADLRELPDHVSAEWEAVAHGLKGGAEQRRAARELVTDHLRVWLPPFCGQVREAASLPFYGLVASLTEAWLPALAELPGGDED